MQCRRHELVAVVAVLCRSGAALAWAWTPASTTSASRALGGCGGQGRLWRTRSLDGRFVSAAVGGGGSDGDANDDMDGRIPPPIVAGDECGDISLSDFASDRLDEDVGDKIDESAFGFVKEEEDDNDDDDDFMSSLRERISQVNDRRTMLPIVVLDSVLPRQVLKIESDDGRFVELVKHLLDEGTDGSTFGMLGVWSYTDGGALRRPLNYGCEMEIVGRPRRSDGLVSGGSGGGGLQVELRAGRRIRIAGEVRTSDGGWTEARVDFLDSNAEEAKEADAESLSRAISKARALTSPNGNMPNYSSLVHRWIELARQNERMPGQIDRLLEDIGEVPDSTSPSELAFWIGALINPLPAMGVSLEIRPALLSARTAEERVSIASDGILTSIRHMDGTKRMW